MRISLIFMSCTYRFMDMLLSPWNGRMMNLMLILLSGYGSMYGQVEYQGKSIKFEG